MKQVALITLALLVSTASAARRLIAVGSGAEAGDRAVTVAAIQDLVRSFVSGEGGVQLAQVVVTASKYVDFATAAQSLQQKHTLPSELSAALATKGVTNETVQSSKVAMDEDSLAKARSFLNALVEAAQKELDDKIIEAKEFEAANRGAQAQVVADIARLGSQIADHMGRSAEATSCIADMNKQLDSVKQQRQGEKDAYDKEYSINFADMTIKQNDLDVFDFLIKSTKKICDAQAFVQVDRQPGLQFCKSHGDAVLRFGDVAVQEKFNNLLTKASHGLLDNALYSTQTWKRTAGLLQQPAGASAKAPVAEGQSEELGAVKCGPIPDCGLLYDTLSLQWGGYKDQVDELKKEMDGNDAAWRDLKSDFGAQISSLTASMDECVNQLSEATASKNSDQQVLEEKEEQKRGLDDVHKKTMQKFRDRITYIVQQDICGPTVIRNEIMKDSTQCPSKDIDDCDVTPWTAMTCSVACDDACPDQAMMCGGTQTLTRDIVVPPNECGIKCPELSRMRKCNQFKCPVDCVMSQWSGWSKCSKDCEGGVQERTRSVITKPKNGGKSCAAVSDGRPCNTGSCDRNCHLEDWTAWSPCSMACGGGDQERVRKVDIPIRGGGTCPTPQSSHRLQDQVCNTVACVGDEICIAKQDLVILVDGSGSISEDGFKLIRNVTGQLLKRYSSKYWGRNAVRVGLVLFGNGAIEEDGTISKALLRQEITGDLAAVREAAAGMERQAGFSNMAQGFAMAEKLLMQKGRKEAQSAVLSFSDGKPSFLFETSEKNKAMKEKGIQFFMLGVAQFPGGDDWKLMQEMASQPAETNTVRVPGIDALQDGGGPFVQQAITKFCPKSLSPSAARQNDDMRGFTLVREGGFCGTFPGTCTQGIFTASACREFAMAYEGNNSFALGRDFRNGQCCVGHHDISCDVYHKWEGSQTDPECDFEDSKFYDWYAVEPDCV